MNSNNITKYYDEHSNNKVKDYIEGNARVEKAWKRILEWAPENPKNILEIGCGVGYICARMSQTWLQANITGIDISPESIRKARELFTSQKINFIIANISHENLLEKIGYNYDLIVLMDVFEHIAQEERYFLYKLLKYCLKPSGRIILTFPTPSQQKYLREHTPEKIQPIDEDVFLEDISRLAQETASRLIFYQEISIWLESDYAHAVLVKDEEKSNVIPESSVIPANAGIQESTTVIPANAGIQAQQEKKKIPAYAGMTSEATGMTPSSSVLAIFLPHLGAVSETFMKRQIQNILPGRTVVITGEIIDGSWCEAPVLTIPYTSGPARYAQEVENKVIEFLKKYNVTHILCQYGWTGTEIVELNVRSLHLPIFIHFHGYDASKIRTMPDMIAYYRWMATKVNGIIAVSKPMAERLSAIGIPKEKIIVNHLGIEIPENIIAVPEKQPCRFVSVMRFVEKKGPLFLLKSFYKALEQAPDISLDIVGDGPLKREVEEFIVNNNLYNSVTLHGAKPFNYVSEILNKSSVFVLHSITDEKTGDAEGLPMSILEASAYGLPVISTFHEGIPEAVENEHTGFLVKEKDIDSMADFMLLLSKSSELRKKMGIAGHRKMLGEFTIDRMTAGLREFMGLSKIVIPADAGISEEKTRKIPAYAGKTGSRDAGMTGSRDAGMTNASLKNESQPLVSVIIPTYNRPDMLERAIDSVLNQTYKSFEIIVINDAGDDIGELISKLNKNNNIKYFRHDLNCGNAAARNTGLKAAKGKYIAYLDDDDLFYLEHLETLVKFLISNEFKVAYTDAACVHLKKSGSEYKIEYKDIPYSEDFNAAKLLVHNYIPNLCVMHEKACLAEIAGFDEDLASHVDWDFLIKLALRFPFAHIKRTTCEFSLRSDGTNLTSKRWLMLQTLKQVYNKTEKYIVDNSEIKNARQAFLGRLEAEVESLKQRDSSKNIISSDIDSSENSVEGDIFQSKENQPPLVSIIIPVFNKAELTKNCLDSLLENTNFEDIEIIVIDNASTDDTPQLLEEYRKIPAFAGMTGENSVIPANAGIYNPKLIIIKNKENFGFGKACNQGIRASNSKYIILLNNDTLPQPGWLDSLIEEVERDSSIGAAGACLLYPENDLIQHVWVTIGTENGTIAPYHAHRFSSLDDMPELMESRYCSAVTGACMLIRREAINKIGLLDEEYINGLEDIDYCFRLLEAGYKIRYCAGSRLYHYESMSQSRHERDIQNWQRLNRKWLGKIKYDETAEETERNNAEIKRREIAALEKNKSDEDFYLESIFGEELVSQKYKPPPAPSLSKEGNQPPPAPSLSKEGNQPPPAPSLSKEGNQPPPAPSLSKEGNQPPPAPSLSKEGIREVDFSIIIPVHNNLGFTKNCIDGILKTKGLNKIELIAIDNASTDDTPEYLKSLGNITHVITNKDNMSYSHINNQGAAIAKGKYLLFLNNDTYPFPGWLDAFKEEFENNPLTAAQGAKLLYENGRIQHAGMIFGKRPGRTEEPYHAYLMSDPAMPFVSRKRKVQFVTAACLAVRREVFYEVGGFDEEYRFGWEDTDFCMKLNQKGKI
ncbi:MAG: hypothetical protein QG635_1067, partial [Bacteroidota bacterium]|nr:hypothetical protein [Bacteroidota bacterium]